MLVVETHHGAQCTGGEGLSEVAHEIAFPFACEGVEEFGGDLCELGFELTCHRRGERRIEQSTDPMVLIRFEHQEVLPPPFVERPGVDSMVIWPTGAALREALVLQQCRNLVVPEDGITVVLSGAIQDRSRASRTSSDAMAKPGAEMSR